MSKFAYDPSITFTPAGLAVIRQADTICAQYAAQGYGLTLRQLYYRFIADDLLPEARRDKALGTKNTERNYKWLGDLVSKGRVAGHIDWAHITDRTRGSSGGDSGWASPAAAVASIRNWYSIPHWPGQANYVEVWVEKEALVDVISRPCGRWNVTYMACKGSPSTSVVRDAALRFRQQQRAGRACTLVYLGDHDPTGLDIDRDIEARLNLFRADVAVDRVALNMDQVQVLNPPPSPVKVTDSRTTGYVDRFGTTDCWELDALPPDQLEQLVEDAILDRLDMAGWDAREERQEQEQVVLAKLERYWAQVARLLDGLPAPE